MLCAVLSVQTSSMKAQTVENVTGMTPEQKAAATSLTLSGKLTDGRDGDFRQMRDLCHNLQVVDLAKADCEAIPNNAFHSRHLLQRIALPEKLRTIGTQAFFACTSLRAVTIPQTTDSVGNAAFSSCTSLRSLTIEGTPVLAPYAFARLSDLQSVTLTSAVPPKASATTFYGLDRTKVTLNIPKGSEKAYRKAAGWRLFFEDEAAPSATCDPCKVLMPQPMTLQVDEKAKPLSVLAQWTVLADNGLQNEKEHGVRILGERIGTAATAATATLSLSLDPTIEGDEAYTLDVAADRVSIKGRTAKGVFYGLMTFDQLLRADGTAQSCAFIPQLHISDRPRTNMRELMVDPCRIFIPFDDLMAFVPEMARYKLNALHLHLVDDQSWRIEIKHYPKLTELSSLRNGMDDMLRPIGGYYTQEQMRQLMAFAAKYHVEVIPEIEMPGHEVAAIHAYPELTCFAKEVPLRTTCGVSNELLCPGNDFTYEFLNNVFAELVEVFPSPYIHLGGDEAGNPALDCWTTCPKCIALKQQLGITTTDRSENWKLQEYLFNRVIDTLRGKYGKTPMFWYETDFKRIQEGCVTFAWRAGLTQAALDAAVSNNAKILLCPGEHCYFDYPMAKGDMPEKNWGMPVTTLEQTYALDPSWGMGEEFEKNNLFGVAGTLWSECINSTERIYYQAYPRALALAEVAWSTAENKSWPSFLQRLTPTLEDMQRRGIAFSMAF